MNDILSIGFMDMTKQHEGFRPTIYKDTEGKRTIGYGFNIDDETVRSFLPSDVVSGQRPITLQEAEQIFTKLYVNGYQNARNFAGDEAFNKLPHEARAILADMSYNLGATKLNEFKELRKALQKGDLSWAAEEMKDSKWYGQVKNRGKTLYGMMKGLSNQVKGY